MNLLNLHRIQLMLGFILTVLVTTPCNPRETSTPQTQQTIAPINPSLLAYIKDHEGYTPTFKSDFDGRSIGYGSNFKTKKDAQNTLWGYARIKIKNKTRLATKDEIGSAFRGLGIKGFYLPEPAAQILLKNSVVKRQQTIQKSFEAQFPGFYQTLTDHEQEKINIVMIDLHYQTGRFYSKLCQQISQKPWAIPNLHQKEVAMILLCSETASTSTFKSGEDCYNTLKIPHVKSKKDPIVVIYGNRQYARNQLLCQLAFPNNPEKVKEISLKGMLLEYERRRKELYQSAPKNTLILHTDPNLAKELAGVNQAAFAAKTSSR